MLDRGDAPSSKRQSLETALYQPVKHFLEARGFEVKGEVRGCDVVGIRRGEPPVVVIGELKLTFNLELLLQAVERSAACDEMWLAVRIGMQAGRESDKRVRKLCRMLGFGLLGVSLHGHVDILVDPGPWRPRRDVRRRSQLVKEHLRRVGDPTIGGGSRLPVMTAYRQQALACAAALKAGPQRPRDLKAALPDAGSILLRNVYGWFARVERGLYALTEEGRTALRRWPQALP
jgi:hypothetical protein